MQILSCVFVIIGVIIGAGFASGQEIYRFFYIYGIKGIIGIFLSALIIGYVIYKSLKIINKYEINSYDDFLKHIVIKHEKNINVETMLNFIINLFLIITFFVMCAGFSAYFQQEFGINSIISSVVIAILSYIILNKNINGVVMLNSILMPLMIIILVVLGVKSCNTSFAMKEEVESFMWLPNAVVYASYNCITLVSMLIPMKKYIKGKNDILKIAVFSMLIIMALAIIIMLLLSNISTEIGKVELPAVYASRPFWESI